jgi:two-component system, NarL family, sensor histidine kinase UhpB
VTLTAPDRGIALTVRDWGRGLAPGFSAGSGIRGMRERAALIGATVEIGANEPARGVELRLEVPVRSGA